MIVRIMGEGQWRIDDALTSDLNVIDALLDADLTMGTESTLAAHIQAIQALIKERGTPVGIEELLPSDAVVPFSGISVAELREFIGQEGLIPG